MDSCYILMNMHILRFWFMFENKIPKFFTVIDVSQLPFTINDSSELHSTHNQPMTTSGSVSYTHLDVYKRQTYFNIT